MTGLGARVAESFGSLAPRLPEPRPAPTSRLPRIDDGHWTYVVGLSVYAYEQGGTTARRDHLRPETASRRLALPFLATLADRYRRERVMMATDLIRAR